MIYILGVMRTFVKGSLLIFAVLLCGWGALPSPRAALQEGAGGKESASDRVKSLFRERCARCHGSDGRGRTTLGEMLAAPDFTDERFWDEEKSNRRLVHSIAAGKGEMPAFSKKLSKREINQLADYVRGFRKPAP